MIITKTNRSIYREIKEWGVKMLIYYPSCTFRKLLPDTTKTVINYLQRDMAIAGCCRTSYAALGEKDKAVDFLDSKIKQHGSTMAL